MQTSTSSRRRPRSASRERDPPSAVAEADDDHEERRAAATMRRMSASAHRHRTRDLSPRPRSMGDMAHKELYAAIPSLQTGGAHLESFNRRTHVRTVVTKKHEWTYGEIHELSRVTSANNRLSARWDFDHASLVIDWWSADRPRRDLCTPRRGPQHPQQQPCVLSRDVLDVIKKARCSDKVYIVVIDAVSLLYQLQGDESPRDLRFAVKNSGARIEITTTGWKKMLLVDLEMLRAKLLPDLVDISLDASANSLLSLTCKPMLNASSIQTCVESGAVNFVNAEPILDVAESRHVASLQLFLDSGATFFYCEVPHSANREENEPYFTFTQHRVVRLDIDAQIVHCSVIWSSAQTIESGSEPGTCFGYHPTLRQWRLLRKVVDPLTKAEALKFSDTHSGYIVANPTGCVPAVILAGNSKAKQQ